MSVCTVCDPLSQRAVAGPRRGRDQDPHDRI